MESLRRTVLAVPPYLLDGGFFEGRTEPDEDSSDLCLLGARFSFDSLAPTDLAELLPFTTARPNIL